MNPCSVYADVTGVLIVAGDYVLEAEDRAATRDELDFVFADGVVIRLSEGKKLVRAAR